ncbi:hypothetical protein C8R44DRAFT_751602 [Mycena epipterygia]|nr:hypothetical protein C8R44DRAFT_751602 [Mycena epipterygia]
MSHRTSVEAVEEPEAEREAPPLIFSLYVLIDAQELDVTSNSNPAGPSDLSSVFPANTSMSDVPHSQPALPVHDPAAQAHLYRSRKALGKWRARLFFSENTAIPKNGCTEMYRSPRCQGCPEGFMNVKRRKWRRCGTALAQQLFLPIRLIHLAPAVQSADYPLSL